MAYSHCVMAHYLAEKYFFKGFALRNGYLFALLHRTELVFFLYSIFNTLHCIISALALDTFSWYNTHRSKTKICLVSWFELLHDFLTLA